MSNGVPSFKKPKARNAASTLAIMGGLTVLMFVGITALALISDVHVAHDRLGSSVRPTATRSAR